MVGKLLVSTAYLPPVSYFSHISHADEIFIEREENYLKQTYRNRCYILAAHGPQILSVPVYLGSVHKTLIKDIRIDYSKRWQQVHLRAMTASYNSSPYFEFYFENIEKVISENHDFLLDLNMEMTELILKIVKINKNISYTTNFEAVGNVDNDFRYKITPKIQSELVFKPYLQVFNNSEGFVPNLSIVDLFFNMGPEAGDYL
ncbi:MAG TPA: WbqC family protein [Bacteroidales bacterium]|nr:WbqC family protein [Bacteroidales bacterium]